MEAILRVLFLLEITKSFLCYARYQKLCFFFSFFFLYSENFLGSQLNQLCTRAMEMYSYAYSCLFTCARIHIHVFTIYAEFLDALDAIPSSTTTTTRTENGINSRSVPHVGAVV